MSIGGNKSKGGGSQSSEGQNFGSEVWGGQSPYLQDLFRRSQGALGSSLGNNQETTYQKMAMGSLNAANNNLGYSSQFLGQFMKPKVDPAVNAYATNLGQQFNEQFLPGLKGEAALAGGLGGSRQQIGAALGAQRSMQSLTDFAAQSYAGQQERKLAAAQGLAANAQTAAGLNQQALAGADFARSLPWYNLAQYQGLLGSPVQIDKGGWQRSSGKNSSSSGGFNFGFGSG